MEVGGTPELTSEKRGRGEEEPLGGGGEGGGGALNEKRPQEISPKAGRGRGA